MTIGDIQPSGFAFKSLLRSTVMQAVRAGLINAVDGLNGGIYTLASKLTLNGTDKFELGGQLLYTARAVPRVRPMPYGQFNTGSVGWSYDAGGLFYRSVTTHAQTFEVPILGLPPGNVLDTVFVRYQGNTGHLGALPTNMPQMVVKQYNSLTKALTATLATVADPSASAAVFEGAHSISATGLAHTIDAGSYYVLTITSESGGSQQLGALCWTVGTICNVTRQSEYG